jgi:hypothetical protein
MQRGSDLVVVRSLHAPVGAILLALLSLAVLPVEPSGATGFVMPDPGSPLYRSFVAVAGDNLKAEQDCLFIGNLQGNGDIDLDKTSAVTGNVSAVGTVKNHGTVTGTVTSHAPVRTLPVFPTEAQARALANRVFTKDTVFKNAVVDDVVFVAGAVTIRGSLNGGGTIIAKGELRLEDIDKDEAAALSPSTKLSLLSFEAIHVGKSRQLRGLLYTQGNAELAEKATLQGVLISGHLLHAGKGAQLTFLELDSAPPLISNLTPTNGSFLANATPTVSAAFSDDLSGVDPSSVLFLLDGSDQTSKAAVTAAALSFTPSAPLPDGSHTAALSVRDLAGNLAQASWSFTTDVTPPIVLITAPSTATVSTVVPALAVSYSDATSGVDLGSLHVVLDAADLTSTCQVGAAGATCTAAPLKAGPHTLAASIRDRAGNPAAASFSFQVVPPPPSVAIPSPAQGSYLASATPAIQGTYSAAVGIDLATVALKLDGADVTAAARIGAAGLTYTPSAPLAEGAHLAQLAASDTAGDAAYASSQFFVDLTPPTLAVTAPAGALVVTNLRPVIALSYGDSGSGVDPTTLQVSVDGAGAPPICTAGTASALCTLAADLAAGAHRVTASIRDAAGNLWSASSSFTLTLDLPPTVTILTPATGSLVTSSSIQVTGTAASAAGVTSVSVNGLTATLAGSQFAAALTLQSGPNSIRADALDAAGLTGSAAVVVTLDNVPPTLNLSSPTPGQIVNTPTVAVAGQVADDNPGVAVTVNGQPAAVQNGAFSVSVPLVEGQNSVLVTATDRAGNVTQSNVAVTRLSLPNVTITSPADLSYVATTTVDVTGTVSDPGDLVTVNGVQAHVAGTAFEAAGIPLIEGGNTLTATATSPSGSVGTASVNVVRDLTAPRLSIDYPRDGSAVFDSAITVSGLVNDIVAGTVNAAQAKVTVNGLPARVANRSFVVDGVPLAPGANTLTAVAVDESGNTGRASVMVRLVSQAGVAQVRAVSGNRQQGVIGTTLPQPLVVQLLDATGAPAVGRSVAFQLRGNNGSLGSAGRVAVVTTDATGRASVSFTLGTRAGSATQVATATAAGFAGPAVFTAGASPGPAALLVVDSGDQQVGVAGQQLPRPLVAVVTDWGFNRLSGIAVDLGVTKGQGRFADGLATLTATSDSDGRVIVPFILDPAEGVANNVVRAQIPGLAGSPGVAFTATGRAAGPASATSVSGVVLDHAGLPIEGVTLRILNTTLVAQTDAQGQFRIAGAPVGAVTLIVDGSTANRPGSWPDLEYSLVTIAGRDNTPNMPIYLLPLDLRQGLPVDETHGGTLTLPEIPGFALQIAPGSVTFPSGGKNGVVSVTVVHDDKVPMVPNFGQQPRLIVTIQPAGARFDPPAQMVLPNLEGLAPGVVTEMYSFDHDLGHFVSIGPATVSDDGSVITSNPGVGVVKAGWHCAGFPTVPATLDRCPTCHECDGQECTPNTGGACDDGDPCTFNDTCIVGTCIGTPVEAGTVTAMANGKTGQVAVAIGSGVQFSAVAKIPGCPSAPTFKWDFGDGATSMEDAPSHTYTAKGAYNVTVQIFCPPCPRILGHDSVMVYVVALDKLTVTRGASQDHVIGAKNWATRRNSGAVTVHAILDPDVAGAADLIEWSGAQPNNMDLHDAFVATSDARDQTVNAKVGTTSDSVDIWIMWATLELRDSGQVPGTDGSTSTPLGTTFPALGPKTAQDGLKGALGDYQIEMVGHLAPQKVNTILASASGWSFVQTLVVSGGCDNGAPLTPEFNIPDGPEHPFESLTVTSDDLIYYIDAPTIGAKDKPPIIHTREVYEQFSAVATWNGDTNIASDPLVWHYTAAANVDLEPNSQVEVNVGGKGPETFPSLGCRYKPAPPPGS